MPSVNGMAQKKAPAKFIDGMDPDDPEYQRSLMRPAEIKEDVKLMEHRKRVSLILKSPAFKKELEEIVRSQLRAGQKASGLVALQALADLLLPRTAFGSSAFAQGATMPVVPINDLRKGEAAAFSKAERLLRCKLASLYRLVDMNGWANGLYTHITARITRDQEHFLINPFGLLYHEITSASLIKIDFDGEVLDQGSTTLGVDRAGWALHAAIHRARSDIRCVLHLQTTPVIAVSCSPHGLLPLSQEAMILGTVAAWEPTGPEDDCHGAAEALGAGGKVLLVRAHGILVCGETLEEAWHLAFNAVSACDAQLRVSHLDVSSLVMPTESVQSRVREVTGQGGGGVDFASSSGHKWGLGELEFEAAMRRLDLAGFRTGYVYRETTVMADRTQHRRKQRHQDEVEIPPASSSATQHAEPDTEEQAKEKAEKAKTGQQTHWLNTPNTYHKEEIQEIGTPYPKKITRWIANTGDENQTSGLATAIVNPNQFAPQGGNPREFKDNQKKVKAKYYHDTTTAGPQSKLLEGVSYEEAAKLQEARDGKLPSGEHILVVGAASKGIIQRDHRHNAVVYQSVYSPNPFDKMTDEDLAEYKHDVERKNAPHLYSDEEEEKAGVVVEQIGESSTDAPPSKKEVSARKPPVLQVVHETSGDIVLPEKKAATLASVPSRLSGSAVQRAESTRVTEERAKVGEELKKKTMLTRSHSEKKEGPGPSTLAPPDTSGAEAGHDTDQGKEGKDKKKKRKFKMPSFSRKSKDKEKHK